MGLPLPTDAVTMLLADAAGPERGATNTDTAIIILPEIEGILDILSGVLPHEVAHHYWRGNREWLDEGMAEMMAAHHRKETTRAEITPFHLPCEEAENIQELKALDLVPSARCHYALGEALLLDLWQELGEGKFREAARELYLMPGPRGHRPGQDGIRPCPVGGAVVPGDRLERRGPIPTRIQVKGAGIETLPATRYTAPPTRGGDSQRQSSGFHFGDHDQASTLVPLSCTTKSLLFATVQVVPQDCPGAQKQEDRHGEPEHGPDDP